MSTINRQNGVAVTICLMLPAQMKKDLDAAAWKKNISLSQFCRAVFAWYFGKEYPTVSAGGVRTPHAPNAKEILDAVGNDASLLREILLTGRLSENEEPEQVFELSEEAKAAEHSAPVKRGRGRPRKNAPKQKPNEPKLANGRPRKNSPHAVKKALQAGIVPEETIEELRKLVAQQNAELLPPLPPQDSQGSQYSQDQPPQNPQYPSAPQPPHPAE